MSLAPWLPPLAGLMKTTCQPRHGHEKKKKRRDQISEKENHVCFHEGERKNACVANL
jgi:hypothetical protein